MPPWNAKLLSVGEVRPDPAWFLSSHSHAFCELIVPIAGRMHVTFPQLSASADAGEVLYYPVGVAHQEASDRSRPVATRFISFIWDCPVANLPMKVADAGERIRQMTNWLFADRDLADSPSARHSRSMLLGAILSSYLLAAQSARQDDDLVRRVRNHIREHLSDTIALNTLAELAGVSRFHFIRVYRKLAGRSPMEDVRSIRLERARELLLTTDLGLKQIAPQCGMGSEYALSRAFSRHFRHPPSQLRRH